MGGVTWKRGEIAEAERLLLGWIEGDTDGDMHGPNCELAAVLKGAG